MEEKIPEVMSSGSFVGGVPNMDYFRLDIPPPNPNNTESIKDFKLNDSLLKQFREIVSRKKNEKNVPKQVIKNRIKTKKSKRRISNKSRKINQKHNRHNKFTK